MKWVKRFLGLAVLLAVAAAVAWSFVPQPVEVDLARVSRGDLRVRIEEEGRTRVHDRYTVSAPLAGILQRILLRPGDQVAAGDVVARIVPAPSPMLDDRTAAQANAQVNAARAAADAADAALLETEARRDIAASERKRLEDYKSRGGDVTAHALEQARLTERAAEASVKSAAFSAAAARGQEAMARAALEFGEGGASAFEIKAPASGQVLRVHQESETAVAPGAPLIEVGDPASLEIVVDLLSEDAVRVEPGMEVEIERWGGPETLKGRVRLVEPAGATRISALGIEEQRVDVIVDFERGEAGARLGDGFRVEAAIIEAERKAAVKVPSGALFRHDGGWAAFVVRDGAAKLVGVAVGYRSGLEAEVIEGLEEGAEVVLHPGDRVHDGAPVTSR